MANSWTFTFVHEFAISTFFDAYADNMVFRNTKGFGTYLLIKEYIGVKPLLAAGNSRGDLEMMQYAQSLKIILNLNGVNKNGAINGFKKLFEIKDAKTGELNFKGGNIYRDGKTESVTKLDPTNKADKNEFKGWVKCSYQALDGTEKHVWTQVTLKTEKNAPIQ